MSKETRPNKRRLDQVVLEQGLAESRHQAQGLIMAGRIRVGGQVSDKPGTQVPSSAQIVVDTGPQYVSRGGAKLDGALDHFRLDVHGAVALDVGASTGGFTDCLLQRGAARVYALDVGRGQLHHRLRTDPRVVVMERVNAHHPFDLAQSVDLVTVDVSFISATKVIPNAAAHLKTGGRVVGLIKPQFEAGRGQVARGGVVKDPLIHGAVLGAIAVWAIDQGFRMRGIAPSVLPGDKGNQEFFLYLGKE